MLNPIRSEASQQTSSAHSSAVPRRRIGLLSIMILTKAGVERTDRYLGAEGMTRMAREMVELDLVITVDTYVAHLAGALGVETWVLLPHGPEWRWGTGGTNSIWYPRARLFRQPRPADWDTVIRKVAAALSARSQ